MKNISFYALFLFTLVINKTHSQTWTQLSNLPFQTVRDTGFNAGYGVGFVIGSTIYYLPTDTAQLWAYNTLTNLWSPKAIFPPGKRVNASGFGIDSVGFITCGYSYGSSPGQKSDLWKYSPATDSWTQKSSILTSTYTREYCISFVINGKGYIGTGKSSSVPALTPYIGQFQEYNPITDSWTIKTSVPDVNNPPFYSNGRGMATAFSFGGKGYVINGIGNGSLLTDTRQYNPITNAWTLISTPFGNIVGGTGISYSDRGLICFGQAGVTNTSLGTVWQLDSTLIWIQKSNFPGVSRKFTSGFTVGCNTYVLGGQNYNSTNVPPVTNLIDFWKSDCNTLPIELLKFDVFCSPNNFDGVIVNWSTASEINCKEFKIVLVLDNNKIIKKVRANGNSNIIQNYSIEYLKSEFENTENPIIKLYEVSFDGLETLVLTKALNCALELDQEIIIYPNPSNNGDFYLKISKFSVDEFMVYDYLGNRIDFSINNSQGLLKLTITEKLTTGVYIIYYKGKHYKIFSTF
jgi:hypothetical protein